MADLKEDLGALRQSLLGDKPRPIQEGIEQLGTSFAAGIIDLQNDLLQKDTEFDQSGVPDFGFRSGLSRADTDEERKAYLDKWAGPKGWTQDRFGAYALTPAGMTMLGYPHKGKPVLIDEPWSLTRYDIADLAGEAPAIAGATAATLATGGMGLAAGMLAAAGGAALGKVAGEGVEEIRGENLQTFSQVAGDVGEEALYAAGGEGLFRGVLAPIGRKILRPRVNKMTPERAELAETAAEMGARPSITQIAPSSLLGRYQSLANMIFGNPLARGNLKAITKETDRLRAATGGKGSDARLSVGDRITKDVSRARGALARWSKGVTDQIDEAVQGQAVVPTSRLKAQAQEVLESLPRKKSTTVNEPSINYRDDLSGRQINLGGTRERPGDVVFSSKETITALEKIKDLPDFYTTGEMQQVTSQLFDAIGSETIVPGITGRNARLLWRASTDSYDDIVDEGIRGAVLRFRGRYHREISLFDNALIERVMKSPKLAGRLEPEEIVGAVFMRGKASKIGRLKAVVTPGTWKEVRRSAMEEVLGKLSKRADDPFEVMFQGKQFLTALDAYGPDTLNAMFGKSLTRDLYKLGRVTQLVTKEAKMTGGIVAASIALHPLKNVGRLLRIFFMADFLNTPFAVRWLTKGLSAPNTREGTAAITRLGIFVKALAEQHTTDPLPAQQESTNRRPPSGVAADTQ